MREVKGSDSVQQSASKRRSLTSSSTSRDTAAVTCNSSALPRVVLERMASGVITEETSSPRPLRQSRRLSARAELSDLNLPSTMSPRMTRGKSVACETAYVNNTGTPTRRSLRISTKGSSDVKALSMPKSGRSSAVKRKSVYDNEISYSNDASSGGEVDTEASTLNSVKKNLLSEENFQKAGTETPTRHSTQRSIQDGGLIPVASQVVENTPTKQLGRRRSIVNSDAVEEVQTPTTRARRRSVVEDNDDTDASQAANRRSLMKSDMTTEVQTPTRQSARINRRSVMLGDSLVSEDTPTRRSSRRKSIDTEAEAVATEATPTRRSSRRKSITDVDVSTPTRRSSRRKSITDVDLPTPTRRSSRRKSITDVDLPTPTRRTSTRRKSLVSSDSKDVNKDMATDSDSSDISVVILSSTTKSSTKASPIPLTPVRKSRRRSVGLDVESEKQEDSITFGNSVSDNETTMIVEENNAGKVLPVIEEEVETSFTENSEAEVMSAANEDSGETARVETSISLKGDSSETTCVKDKVEQSALEENLSKSPVNSEAELKLKLVESDEESWAVSRFLSEADVEPVVSDETLIEDQNDIVDNNNEKFATQKSQSREDMDTCTVDSITTITSEEEQVNDQEEVPSVMKPDDVSDSSAKSILQQSATKISDKPEESNDNKENEPVIADQTVSTTYDLESDPCRVREGSGEEADPAVSPDDLPTSTTTDLHHEVPSTTQNLENRDSSIPNVQTKKKKVSKELTDIERKLDQIKSIPRGLPESGRFWKSEKNRFSSVMKDNTGVKSWNKKMQRKKEREEVMAKFTAVEAEKQQRRENLKHRQKLNKILRAENEQKSEIVQVIRDSRKVKKMSKKQLRYISTRDTTNMKPGN